MGPWRVPLLEAATSAGHAEITELLLARGADPDQYNAQDCHPLYGVAQFGDVRMAALLLDGGATVDRVTGPRHNMGNAEASLYVAAASGQTAMVELLLARGARVDVANRVGGSPLYMAAQCGRVEILKILAAAGADVDQGRTDDSSVGGSSPLLMACSAGHAAVVEALAERGADLDSLNNNGMTPLKTIKGSEACCPSASFGDYRCRFDAAHKICFDTALEHAQSNIGVIVENNCYYAKHGVGAPMASKKNKNKMTTSSQQTPSSRTDIFPVRL